MRYEKHINFLDGFIFFDNESDFWFPEAPGNRHYQEYLEWLAEGNEPEVIND